MARTPEGKLYVNGMLNAGKTHFMLSADSLGNPLWANTFEPADTNNRMYFIYDLLPRTNRISFTTGISVKNSNDTSLVIVTMDEGGKLLWSKRYAAFSSSGSSFRWPAATQDAEGNVTVLGEKEIYSIDSTGSLRWATQLAKGGYESWNTSTSDAANLTALHDGNIIYSCSETNNTVLLKLDKQGRLLTRSETFIQFKCNIIKELPDGNLMVSGSNLNWYGANSIMLLTPDFKIIKSFRINNIYLHYSACLSDGRLFLSGHSVSGDYYNALVLFGNNLTLECTDTFPMYTQKAGDLKLSSYSFTPADIGFHSRPLWVVAHDTTLETSLECLSCKIPEVSLGPDITACGRKTVTLKTKEDSGYTYLWQDGSHGSSYTAVKSGTYWLKATNACGSAADTIVINLGAPLPRVFGMSSEAARPEEEVLFSLDTANIEEYSWDFGDGVVSTDPLPSHVFNKTGFFSIRLHIKNKQGCDTTLSATLEVFEYHLYLPNTFSPNADSRNDVFGPVGMGWNSYSLCIFNRWGEQIFLGENEGWNGTSHGKAVPEGVYFYKLELTDMHGRKETRKGTLELLQPKKL